MRYLVALLLWLGAVAAHAHPFPQGEYRTLQELDRKLFEAGWTLATANAQYCDRTEPSLGIMWQDLDAYGDPAAARGAYGLEGPIVVRAVAPGSPAARAALRPGHTLVAIGERQLRESFPASDPSWRRVLAVRAALHDALRHNGSVMLTTGQEGTPIVTTQRYRSVPACVSRFETGPIGKRAIADGERVLFGYEFPAFAYPPEEFAAVVAHELAHNLLDHREWLNANGRKRRNVRLTEREADRLAPWLLANAGIDPAAMARMMRRWGPDHGGGLLRKRTHEGWDERVEHIEAEIVRLENFRGASGRADWSRHFRREFVRREVSR